MFHEKVVIVTGAGGGIGRGIALEFAQKGARVVIAEIDNEKGRQAEEYIKGNNQQALFIQTDVGQEKSIRNMAAEVEKTWGRIDVLINNAGISYWESPFEISVDQWDKIINVNLRGAFLCSRECGKLMAKGGGGAIINIASTRAFMSEPGSEVYAASKGGIIALTHALAASFAPEGITVNCISPGWIHNSNYEGLTEEEHRQHFSNRVGRSEDIARACLFLANKDNNFINGANLIIDGGMTKKMIYV
ncbi:MAG: glucose 1-dehydrogenase [Bacillota bacterium]